MREPNVGRELLQPVLARAAESAKGRAGVLHDPGAIRVANLLRREAATLDHREGALLGAALRSRMMDEDVQSYLSLHPRGTVVELGCGLSTRFERLDNGTATFVVVDSEATMHLRASLFEPHSRRQDLVASGHRNWEQALDALHLQSASPLCFVAESTFLSMDETEVRRVLRELSTAFPGAWLLVDTGVGAPEAEEGVEVGLPKLPLPGWLRWRCQEPRELEGWGVGLVLDRSRTFFDVSPQLKERTSFTLRACFAMAPAMLRRRFSGYHLNRFVLG